MATTTAQRIRTNGAELYVDTRGDGPPLLLIPGACGDGGQYDALAQELSSDHTVVTYDRRGNSRSPRPDNWRETSVDEQADDAAGVCRALGLTTVGVYGNSTGALIALGLLLRHPEVVSGAVLHEPALMSVLADPNAAIGAVQPVIGAAMAQSGPRGATEAFLRFAGGPAYDAIGDDVRERMLGNGEVLLEYEFGSFASWRPSDDGLSRVRTPVTVLSAGETAPFFVEAAGWLAGRTGTQPRTAPGGHMAFLDHPAQIASLVREALG